MKRFGAMPRVYSLKRHHLAALLIGIAVSLAVVGAAFIVHAFGLLDNSNALVDWNTLDYIVSETSLPGNATLATANDVTRNMSALLGFALADALPDPSNPYSFLSTCKSFDSYSERLSQAGAEVTVVKSIVCNPIDLVNQQLDYKNNTGLIYNNLFNAVLINSCPPASKQACFAKLCNAFLDDNRLRDLGLSDYIVKNWVCNLGKTLFSPRSSADAVSSEALSSINVSTSVFVPLLATLKLAGYYLFGRAWTDVYTGHEDPDRCLWLPLGPGGSLEDWRLL